MRKYYAIALGLVIALGCSSKGRNQMVDPVLQTDRLESEPQPLIERQEGQDGDLTDADIRDEGPGTGELKPIFFQYDRSDISQDQLPVLTSNAQVISIQGLQHIRIEGHCDERGTEEYNLALGDRRAKRAREALVVMGVNEADIQTISFGESRPFQGGHDEEAWSSNRRAEFVALER